MNVSAGAERAPRDWPRIAPYLVAATMAYNVVEAVVALWSGALAASIALIGFGPRLWRRSPARISRSRCSSVSPRTRLRVGGGPTPSAALAMVPWLGKEGLDAIRGEDD